MSTCDTSIGSYQSEDGELDVVEKYEQLMLTTLSEESLYTRAKETLFFQFAELQITEKEKAALTVDFTSKFTVELTKSAMATALAWSKEERDGAYELALIKANTSNALANYKKISEEICVLRKEDELKCVQIEATSAQSIRENGRVETYKLNDDGSMSCHASSLYEEGLKYYQTKQVQADSQKIFSETYRKSGVVQLGTDTDGNYKGLTGNSHDVAGELAGYTAQQTANAERQRIAYEDSKINHAANSSASMIGQMLSAEVPPETQDVQRWRDAVDRLLNKHSTTSST